MKNLQIFCLFLLCNAVFAHSGASSNQFLRHWSIQTENKFLDGTFLMTKNGEIYIEDANSNIFHFPITSFAAADQEYAHLRTAKTVALNTNVVNQNNAALQNELKSKMLFIIFLLGISSILLLQYTDRKKLKFILPMLFTGVVMTLFSFAKKTSTATDPAFMTSAFAPFASTVSTSYDATYFYVNSTGIPNHTMMVGISSAGWQQQVPTSKCYIGTSKWSIPLNPVAATYPVIVNGSHFTKGAIAMATNGVPIFNPYTNTGADAFTTGQLDNYGGHCGRGDDYHYHTAPLHLISLGQTNYTLPIAFGLDGYAVYGTLEPTGAAMATLDANHGHTFGGAYHYHGTATAPYMIGYMVGVVTEDSAAQIIPQPQGTPIRTENWGPLNGALITSCIANASNGYNTTYKLNNVAGYATNYTATATGSYTFSYVTPTGTTTTVYNGPAQCVVPNLGVASVISVEQNITLYPNPATDILHIDLGNYFLTNDVQSVSVYDFKGSMVLKTLHFNENIDVKTLTKGTYFVKIEFPNSVITKKLLMK